MMTAEQLKPFCSEDETRHLLQSPYICNGNTHATDGRIAVRVFGIVEGVEENGRSPDTAIVIDTLLNAGPWLAIELPEGVGEDTTCESCGVGRGRDRICPACKQTGQVEGRFVFRGREYAIQGDCPVCGGDGGCSDCDGTGYVHDERPVQVGRNWYKAHYLRRLMALPNVAMTDSEVNEPALVRFDGGDGALMPLNVELWKEHMRAHGKSDDIGGQAR